ncbi:MAG: OsmC family protein [Gammaproteobacteria bacterium]|nr:OsmC family protein [Gammaproteobacteria bacterium]
MQATIRWVGEAMFLAETGSGHTLVIDGPPEGGGRNLGVRPMEMVLAGTAGCSAYDVVSILRKARQDVRDCVVQVEADRAAEPPQVFTRIHMHFIVTGRDLKERQVQRAIDLSATKYCSASIMLAHAVTISHDYEIVAAD